MLHWCWREGINSQSRGFGMLELQLCAGQPMSLGQSSSFSGFNLPHYKPLCGGRHPGSGHASIHQERVKVSLTVLMSICSVSCQSRAIHRPVHTMCPSSLRNNGKDQCICQECMLLISMCGRIDLYGKERFVSLVCVWSFFCKQWLLPPHLSENISKFHCLYILKNGNNMKHNDH